MPRRRRSPSPSSLDLSDLVDSVRCHPPGLRPLLPRLTRQELLRHSLSAQALIVQRLIVVLGLDFRVSYSPVDRPDSYVVTALCNCFGLDVLIQGGFRLVDVPSADALFQGDSPSD
jgi:hypothetical protein